MFRAFAAFCLLVLCPSAFAQLGDTVPGLYAGGALGRSQPSEFCGLRAGCDEEGTALRLFAGFQFRSWFGLELGYNNLGKISAFVLREPVRVEVGDLTPAFTLRVEPFSVHARIGLYAGSGNSGPTLALGAGYRIDRNLALRAEWQQFYPVWASSALDAEVISLGARWSF